MEHNYVWGVSNINETYMAVCLNCYKTLMSSEILIIQIDAGDHEVWGVNASNHIFKCPVNGSYTVENDSYLI